MPKYKFQHIGGGMSVERDMRSLSKSFDQFDQSALFSSELGSKFSLRTNVYWQKKIGGTSHDIGLAIAVDGSGNVYLNGYQQNLTVMVGGNDYGVVKLDTNGNVIWQKKVGGTVTNNGSAIAVDDKGSVYLHGDYGVIN